MRIGAMNQRKLLELKCHFERESSVTTVIKKANFVVVIGVKQGGQDHQESDNHVSRMNGTIEHDAW